MTDDEIRAKLTKLLRLSKSPNRHEAELAQDMYDRLSQKHGIKIEDAEADPSGLAELRFQVEGFDLRHKLASSLVMLETEIGVAIAQRIAKAPRTVFFIGLPERLEPAKEMFLHIASEMQRGWTLFTAEPLFEEPPFCRWCNAMGRRNGCLACVDQPRQPKKKSKTDFYHGVHHAMHLRMAEARQRLKYDEQTADTMLAFICGLSNEWPENKTVEHHAGSVAVLDSSPALQNKIESYVDKSFPGVQKKQVVIKSERTVSFDYGCRFGLQVAMRDCPAIEL